MSKIYKKKNIDIKKLINDSSRKGEIGVYLDNEHQDFVSQVRTLGIETDLYDGIMKGNFACYKGNLFDLLLDCFTKNSVLDTSFLMNTMVANGFKSTKLDMLELSKSKKFEDFVKLAKGHIDQKGFVDFLKSVDASTLGAFLSVDEFKDYAKTMLNNFSNSVLTKMLVEQELSWGILDKLSGILPELYMKISSALAKFSTKDFGKLWGHFDDVIARAIYSNEDFQKKLSKNFDTKDGILVALEKMPASSLDNLTKLPLFKEVAGAVLKSLSESPKNDQLLKYTLRCGSVEFAKFVFEECGLISKLTSTQKNDLLNWLEESSGNSTKVLDYMLSVQKTHSGWLTSDESGQEKYCYKVSKALSTAITLDKFTDFAKIFNTHLELCFSSKASEDAKQQLVKFVVSKGLPACIVTDSLFPDGPQPSSATGDAYCRGDGSSRLPVLKMIADGTWTKPLVPDICVAESSPSAQASAPHAPDSSPLWTLSVWAAWGVSVGISTLAVVLKVSRWNNNLEDTWLLESKMANNYAINTEKWLAVLGVAASYAVCNTFIAGEANDTPDVF